MPVSLNTDATCSASRSSRIPSASSISEEPVFPEADRLPCFKTGTPAAAVRIEAMLEMFTVPIKSPPVPTMSTAWFPVSSLRLLESIASTRPEISSSDSPFWRKPISSATIKPSSVFPAMILSNAQVASALLRSAPSANLLSNCGQFRDWVMAKSLVMN